jgi:hypothetical protein
VVILAYCYLSPVLSILVEWLPGWDHHLPERLIFLTGLLICL